MNKVDDQRPFWETKTLDQMSAPEWESLCDGCGRCCLYVLQNDETGDVFETDVGCKLFNAKTRRCMNYGNRAQLVPDCVTLTAQNVEALNWMPKTCAYRRLANGKSLPKWHPLRTGDRQSVVDAGIAVSPDLVSGHDITDDMLESRITKAR